MKIDLTIVQIALIFFPGIIWSGLDAKFAHKGDKTNFHAIVDTFIFGVFCYVATFLIYGLCGKTFDVFSQMNANNGHVNFEAVIDEIIVATGLSLAFGIAWLYVVNYKILVRIFQAIGATKKYGDEDVWDYAFNSRGPTGEYVYYRDFEKKIVYSGWVHVFSETDRLRELILRDAEIYDFDGNLILETPSIYLSGKPEGMHIEFPFKASAEQRDGGND